MFQLDFLLLSWLSFLATAAEDFAQSETLLESQNILDRENQASWQSNCVPPEHPITYNQRVNEKSVKVYWSRAKGANSYLVQTSSPSSPAQAWATIATTKRMHWIIESSNIDKIDVRVAAHNDCGTSYSPLFTLVLKKNSEQKIVNQKDQKKQVVKPQKDVKKVKEKCQRASHPFPVQKKIENMDPGSAVLYWPKVEGADMYLVECRQGMRWTKMVEIRENQWELKGFPAGEIVTIRVASINKCGKNFSNIVVVTCASICLKPLSPSVLVNRFVHRSALITWDKIPTATSYQVELTETNKGWERLATTTLLSFRISNTLNPSTTYQVRVAARNQCGMVFSMVMTVPQFSKTTPPVVFPTLSVRKYPGERRDAIKYSVSVIVRQLFEGLSKSAESALAPNQGDSTDVAQQVAAIFASAAEAAATTEKRTKQSIEKENRFEIKLNSDRIANKIWNPRVDGQEMLVTNQENCDYQCQSFGRNHSRCLVWKWECP